MTTNKAKHSFNHILAMDCETTGLCFGTDSPVYNPATNERHQAVSWGLVVLKADTLEQVDEMYVEIKWNDDSIRQQQQDPTFGKYAEGIHGLTKEYLHDNGVTEEEAIELIWEMIGKYWCPESKFCCLGHNVHLFDVSFFKDLFHRHGVPLKFGSRHVDSFSCGMAGFETYTSDELFNLIGFDDRGDHNALDDVKMSIASVKAVRDIVQQAIKG